MTTVVFSEIPCAPDERVTHEHWQWQVTSKRLPRSAVCDLQNMAEILDQANLILQKAHQEASSIRDRAYAQGMQAAETAISSAITDALLRVQYEAKAYLDAAEPRVVQLVFAVLRRLLPHLTPDITIESLVDEALRAVQAAHFVRVYVNPGVEALAQSLVDQWRQRQPEIQHLEIITDDRLSPTECRVESPYGEVGVNLQERFEKIVRSYEQAQSCERAQSDQQNAKNA